MGVVVERILAMLVGAQMNLSNFMMEIHDDEYLKPISITDTDIEYLHF